MNQTRGKPKDATPELLERYRKEELALIGELKEGSKENEDYYCPKLLKRVKEAQQRRYKLEKELSQSVV